MEKSMRRRSSSFCASSMLYLLLLLLTLIVAKKGGIISVAEGGKGRIHIPDDLEDVIDDEEDEAWKEWGKSSSPSEEFDPPPPLDFSRMNPSEMQAEMMKRNSGPSFGFVKLRLGVRRSAEMVTEIAMKWTKVLRTGSIQAKFMAVDGYTIMFTMERGKDTSELKDFVLNQPEAYEMKIGDQVFRRPGDPPLEEIVEKLRSEKSKAHDDSPMESLEYQKDEF